MVVLDKFLDIMRLTDDDDYEDDEFFDEDYEDDYEEKPKKGGFFRRGRDESYDTEEDDYDYEPPARDRKSVV